MKYTILYLLAVAFVISQLLGYTFGLLMSVLFILIVSVLATTDAAKAAKANKENSEGITGLKNTVDAISRQVNDIRANSEKAASSLENRIDEVKTDYRLELESQYRDLAKKIIEVENRLLEIRKTVGAAFGTIEDRLESR